MTGFTLQRAEAHERAVQLICNQLCQRGYRALKLAFDGNRPDIRVNERVSFGLQVKTRSGNDDISPCYSIAIDSLRAAMQSEYAVFIVFVNHGTFSDIAEAQIVLAEHCAGLICGGPSRRSGNGSLTEFVIVNPKRIYRRVRLWDFFPVKFVRVKQ